jgi:UTP--glucose-1-phosphate uridylyltransferase
MVEKPSAKTAPSRLAIIGRYVLVPAIFNSIAAIKPGKLGEYQLTDGIRHLLGSRPVYGLLFEGTRFDAGDKQGFLRATVEYALARPDLGADFREYLRSLNI